MVVATDEVMRRKGGQQAPEKLLYPARRIDNHHYNYNNDNFYADSPSRNVRRSARVASLSPSSFTPLIQEPAPGTISNSSSISASSSASSFMPSSPSRKYSTMKGGDSDIISINDIEANTRNSAQPNNSSSHSSNSKILQSNPDRKHPTLNFQPTNLSTPSTRLNTTSSGITPSVRQMTMQETPSQRILDNLVSQKEMEEIAKATPLGSFYNKTIGKLFSKDGDGGRAVVVNNSREESISSSITSSNHHHPQYRIKQTNGGYTMNATNNNQSNTTGYNINNSNSVQNSNNNMQHNTQPQTHTQNNNHTPKKQINVNTPVSSSDETVKVIHNLRNRSIIASPLPERTTNRRSSFVIRQQQQANSRPVEVFSVFVKKHQKNLLAYALITLFILASGYHIFDGITRSPNTGISTGVYNEKATVFESPSTIPSPAASPPIELVISQLIDSKLEEFKQVQVDKFTRIEEFLKQQQEVEKIKVAESSKTTFSLKSLIENKFKALESRIEKIEVQDRKMKISPPVEQIQATPVDLASTAKIVKHLTTSPLRHSSSWFSSSSSSFASSLNNKPENCISSNSYNPFIFKGNRGKVTLQFPGAIKPRRVLIEHPQGAPDRSCAPRDFEIWALRNVLNERDRPVLIGKGTFDFARETSFSLREIDENLSILQLRIRNNYGNDRFTCLYRFKVFV